MSIDTRSIINHHPFSFGLPRVPVPHTVVLRCRVLRPMLLLDAATNVPYLVQPYLPLSPPVVICLHAFYHSSTHTLFLKKNSQKHGRRTSLPCRICASCFLTRSSHLHRSLRCSNRSFVQGSSNTSCTAPPLRATHPRQEHGQQHRSENASSGIASYTKTKTLTLLVGRS